MGAGFSVLIEGTNNSNIEHGNVAGVGLRFGLPLELLTAGPMVKARYLNPSRGIGMLLRHPAGLWAGLSVVQSNLKYTLFVFSGNPV